MESKEPPRNHGKAKAVVSLGLSNESEKIDGKKTTKKTAEQKARRKAKLREAHLKKLAEAGKYDPKRPVNPDPERLLSSFI